MSLGLYIHIPFCRTKCLYCDFYSVRFDPDVNRDYIRGLGLELKSRAVGLKGRPVDTVFFGGGTPSLLSVKDVAHILEQVTRAFPGWPGEITLECNPGTLSLEYLRDLSGTGVNRLSLGVQSLDSGSLRVLGRTHTVEDGVQAFHMARRAGYRNVSVDLIFGVPGQSLSSWRETLQGVVRLEPEHVSVYELTLDGPSPLKAAVETGKVRLLSEGLLEDMYRLTRDILEHAGLRQYEISNFGRPGAECLHNMNCWQYGEYIGVGPAAHSFIGGRRSWNLPDVTAYLAAVIRTGSAEAGHEILSQRDAEFERTMLALRMRSGMARDRISGNLSKSFHELRNAGFLEEVEGRVRLTVRGMLLSNEVLLRLR